jgi:hypothetical protein
MSSIDPSWGTTYWRQDSSLPELKKQHMDECQTKNKSPGEAPNSAHELSHKIKCGYMFICAFKRENTLSQSGSKESLVNQQMVDA